MAADGRQMNSTRIKDEDLLQTVTCVSTAHRPAEDADSDGAGLGAT